MFLFPAQKYKIQLYPSEFSRIQNLSGRRNVYIRLKESNNKLTICTFVANFVSDHEKAEISNAHTTYPGLDCGLFFTGFVF